jgi:hypothetical protein
MTYIQLFSSRITFFLRVDSNLKLKFGTFDSRIDFYPEIWNFWYHGEYVRITVIYRDFSKVRLCSFCKTTVNHCDSNIPTMIPNIGCSTHYYTNIPKHESFFLQANINHFSFNSLLFVINLIWFSTCSTRVSSDGKNVTAAAINSSGRKVCVFYLVIFVVVFY